jgi:transcriptional regulator
MGDDANTQADLLQGTLELLILKTLASGEKHGYEIAEWIHVASAEALSVEEGALYPALHRLEVRGLLAAEWDISANNRRAKYYRLTPSGRKRLKENTRVVAQSERRDQSGAGSELTIWPNGGAVCLCVFVPL